MAMPGGRAGADAGRRRHRTRGRHGTQSTSRLLGGAGGDGVAQRGDGRCAATRSRRRAGTSTCSPPPRPWPFSTTRTTRTARSRRFARGQLQCRRPARVAALRTTFSAMEVVNSGAMRSDWMEPIRSWFALLNRGLPYHADRRQRLTRRQPLHRRPGADLRPCRRRAAWPHRRRSRRSPASWPAAWW